jgi:hypothetical protein
MESFAQACGRYYILHAGGTPVGLSEQANLEVFGSEAGQKRNWGSIARWEADAIIHSLWCKDRRLGAVHVWKFKVRP